MPCPAPESLAALLGESLSAAEQSRLAGHLDECAGCRAKLETLAGGDKLSGDTAIGPPPTVPPRVREVIARCKTISPATKHGGRDAPLSLDFLKPAAKPGVLGLFGPYEVLEVIGHGGMGIVMRAFDPALMRIVAVKVLLPGLAVGEEARQRFLREARTAAAVVHDHVVPIHAVGEERGLPYLVMQHVAGESLHERIAERGPLPVEEVLSLGRQIALGLAAAHGKGLVHRDIKPANILLDAAGGRVKITDFGLAKIADDTSLTQSGVLAGTPEYMAPEQARGEAVDHRADLFALGAVLYAMCAGVSPFAGDTTYAVIRRVCDEPARPLGELRSGLPPHLVALIERLLAKDPAARVQTAEEVSRLLGGEQTELAPPAGSNALIGGLRALLWSVAVVLALAFWLVFAYGNLIVGPPATVLYPPPKIAPAAPPDPTPIQPPVDDGSLPGFRIGGKPGRYDTLAAAAEAAASGDSISVRGEGPFPTPPVQLAGKNLTVLAWPGSRPRIIAAPQTGTTRPLIETDGKLSLIGLDLAWAGGPPPRLEKVAAGMLARSTLVSRGGEVTLFQCRLASDEGNGCLGIEGGIVRINQCHLLSPEGTALRWHIGSGGEVLCTGSIFDAKSAVAIWYERNPEVRASPQLNLDRSTIVATHVLKLLVVNDLSQTAGVADGERWRINLTDNLVLCDTAFDTQPVLPPAAPARFQMRVTERLKQLITLRDSGNVYSGTTALLSITRAMGQTAVVSDLAGWTAFWNQPAATSRVATARLTGGSPRTNTGDYRVTSLDPPSPDGKLPGAVVEAVGPGGTSP